jgi:hypothetical protein
LEGYVGFPQQEANMKTCGKCKEIKPLTEFYKDKSRGDGLTYRCKVCQTEDNARYMASPEGKENGAKRYQKWRDENLEFARKLSRESNQRARLEDPERFRDYERKKNYGITGDEYRALLAAQDYRCAICATTEPKGNGGFHVDHCHSSGRIRALLCSNCNTGLGKFRDSPSTLRKAAAYLEAFTLLNRS